MQEAFRKHTCISLNSTYIILTNFCLVNKILQKSFHEEPLKPPPMSTYQTPATRTNSHQSQQTCTASKPQSHKLTPLPLIGLRTRWVGWTQGAKNVCITHWWSVPEKTCSHIHCPPPYCACTPDKQAVMKCWGVRYSKLKKTLGAPTSGS